MEWGTRRKMVLHAGLKWKPVERWWSFFLSWGCRMMYSFRKKSSSRTGHVGKWNDIAVFWCAPFISKTRSHLLMVYHIHLRKQVSLEASRWMPRGKKVSLEKFHIYIYTNRPFVSFVATPAMPSEVLTLHSESTAPAIGNQKIWSLAVPAVTTETWVQPTQPTQPSQPATVEGKTREKTPNN